VIRVTLARVTALALGAGLAFAPCPSFASPAASGGFGARARSLGGAATAVSDDSAAVFENPSGLALAAGTELSFGFAVDAYSFEENGVEVPLERVDSFEFGLVVPGAIREVPVAFGFALSLPNGRLSRIRTATPVESFWPLPEANNQMVDLAAALAFRPFRQLSLGVGLGYLASLEGGFRITGTAVAVDRFGNEYDSDLRHAVRADLTSSRYLLLGARALVSDAVSLGLAYRGAASVEQEITGGLEGTLRTGPIDIPVVYAFQTSATVSYSPAELELGVAVRPRERTLLSADLAYQFWSGYPSPYANTSNRLDAELPPGLEVELPPPVVGSEPPPSGFENRLVPRLGFEQAFDASRALRLLGRLGYAFEASPVPRDQAATRFLDLDRHDLCAGAGAELSGRGLPFQKLALDAFVTLALGVSRTVNAGGAQRVEGSAVAGGVSLRLVFGSGPR
jgi:long-subunit fatty acid transport protein